MRHAALALLLFVPAILSSAPGGKGARRHGGPVKSASEAKAIAEQETGGKAVTARRVALNGASGGWEVDVRVPHEDKGWRCVIDADTHMVYTKTRIDQPGAKGKAEGSARVVKGRH